MHRTSMFPFVVALSALVSAASVAACSAGSGSGTGGSGGSSSGTNGQGGSSNASTGAFGTGSGGSSGGVGCTSDLQGVVDANGNVVMQCPPDQGCLGGQCVAACTAAAGSNGSIGCDFRPADPPFYRNAEGSIYDGACYAVFLANTWSRPVKVTVERGGQTYDVTQFGRIPKGIDPNTAYDPIPATGIPPNEVAVLFLSHKPGVHHDLGTSLECPVTPAVLADAAVQGSGKGLAFHITTDTPVTAYDILPYGGAKSYLPSASLLFPATAWGTNYVVGGPHIENGSPWMTLVGTADNTMVNVVPKNALPAGGGVPGAPAGVATMVTLNAGETLQWLGGDPSTTILDATAPIGVLTGNTYTRVATATSPAGGGQDSTHQQVPQVKALGSEYVGTNIVTRLANDGPESVPYRLVGVVDGTQLTWEPAAPTGAPTSLNAGQVVEFETTQTFVVKSQDDAHPYAFSIYMPGTPGTSGNSKSGCGPVPPFQGLTQCGLGDEEWVSLLSPKQFLSHYVFFTDPTYATTNLVVTRVKGPTGFQDVTIDCLGGPISNWQPVGTSGNYEIAYVDLVRGQTPVGNCSSSRQEATSKGSFGVVVWGTDWYASYGYPAGGNIGSINDVVVPPIPN